MIELFRKFIQGTASKEAPSKPKSKPPESNENIQLGDDAKATYPAWSQDAILAAWKTGRTVVRNRPIDSNKP